MSPAAFWVLVALVVLVAYAVAVWWWPWQNCPRCKGSGKHWSPTGRYHRTCGRCAGAGRLYRLPIRINRAVRRAVRR